MTGTIKTPILNQQLFWNSSWLKQACSKLINNGASSQPFSELDADTTFSVPEMFDDYAAEGEEPADLALLDLIPADLALLNLPCAISSEPVTDTASSISLTTDVDRENEENEELASLIPLELGSFSQQLEQAA